MKYFINCGAHKGIAINKFLKDVPDPEAWIIHAFEPNPYCVTEYHTGVIRHNDAIWINDGFINFYVGTIRKRIEGASVIKNKTSGRLDVDNPLRIPCIDFGAWIKKNFTMEDYIVVQMDIEGAEYHVLPSMIKDGSLDYIDILYLEEHHDRVGISEVDNAKLLKEVAEKTVLRKEYMLWDAKGNK